MFHLPFVLDMDHVHSGPFESPRSGLPYGSAPSQKALALWLHLNKEVAPELPSRSQTLFREEILSPCEASLVATYFLTSLADMRALGQCT